MKKINQKQIDALSKRAKSVNKDDITSLLMLELISESVYYEVAPGRFGVYLYNAKKESPFFLPKLFIRDL